VKFLKICPFARSSNCQLSQPSLVQPAQLPFRRRTRSHRNLFWSNVVALVQAPALSSLAPAPDPASLRASGTQTPRSARQNGAALPGSPRRGGPSWPWSIRRTVWPWQQCFAQSGVEGLLRDRTRKPRKATTQHSGNRGPRGGVDMHGTAAQATLWTGRAMSHLQGF
jgi:hypothetical protein